MTTAQLPLFFQRVVGVSPAAHGHLRLERGGELGFAATAQTLPLGLGEIEAAARNYPVLFTTGADPLPVALLGLAEGSNLFVDAEGHWRKECYVPAHVRAYPFILVEDKPNSTTYVGMDDSAACLGTERGQALFEDGKPTPALNEAIAFCSSYRANLAAAAAMAKALEAAGLLHEEEARVNFRDGTVMRLRGFRLLHRDRLDHVSDEMFLDWRRRGWLGAIYAHVHSAWQWTKLIDLAAAGRTGNGAAA